MLKKCLVFWESEPQYAYKRYAYKKCSCLKWLEKSFGKIFFWYHVSFSTLWRQLWHCFGIYLSFCNFVAFLSDLISFFMKWLSWLSLFERIKVTFRTNSFWYFGFDVICDAIMLFPYFTTSLPFWTT